MKNIICLILSIGILFISLVACDNENDTESYFNDNASIAQFDDKNSSTSVSKSIKDLDIDIINSYIGSWNDRLQQCFMTIEHHNNDEFIITIEEGSIDWESTWQLEGTYDTKQQSIVYEGERITTTRDRDDYTKSPVKTTTKEKGIIYIAEISGDLCWEPYSEKKEPPYILSRPTDDAENFETNNFNSSVNNVKEFTEAEIYSAGLQFMWEAIGDTAYSNYYWEYVKNVSAKKESEYSYTATFYVYSSELKSYKYLRVYMRKDFDDNLVFVRGGM